ncbi:MAG TPA: hypothetical protein DCG75_02030 [Bacteroidales bacterium]|nr:hypothetical protein [Bacteroidales bacterium]
MAITIVNINYFKVYSLAHRRYKFCVQVNIFSETVEKSFSKGVMDENMFKTNELQYWIRRGLVTGFMA